MNNSWLARVSRFRLLGYKNPIFFFSVIHAKLFYFHFVCYFAVALPQHLNMKWDPTFNQMFEFVKAFQNELIGMKWLIRSRYTEMHQKSRFKLFRSVAIQRIHITWELFYFWHCYNLYMEQSNWKCQCVCYYLVAMTLSQMRDNLE